MGIPVVQITAIPNIPQMIGVNRIVQGTAITNPTGDPSLTEEQEKELRRRLILKALELLQKDVEGPTLVTVEEE
jgi:glycine/betaine/sarcosine/D-proline reductase family selenoprotein B